MTVQNSINGKLTCIPNNKEFPSIQLTSLGVASQLTAILTAVTDADRASDAFTGINTERWIYYRCAYSFLSDCLYAKMFYDSSADGVAEVNSLKKEKYFGSTYIDGRFELLYKTNDLFTLTIKYASNLNSTFMVRHLFIYSDLIPKDVNIHLLYIFLK